MLQLVLQDDSMPRTVYWNHFLEALQTHNACFRNSQDLLIPVEDIACETNWPFYGNSTAAYTRGQAHDYGSVTSYLEKIVQFALRNETKRLLVVNMHPFWRAPFSLRNIKNVYVADGNLVQFERALNPRSISLPALPISTGVPADLGSRNILASFQGLASHPVRHTLATIADGKNIVVNIVEESNHFGKINALDKTKDVRYEELLRDSIFAFVPRGDANFSYRLLEVMSFGCIPIILSDGWVLPFDRVLDWDTFSLNFSSDAISLIPGILGSLGSDEIALRFKKVQTVYDAHFKDLPRILDTLFDELGSL